MILPRWRTLTLWALYIWSCSQPCFWKTVCCPPHFYLETAAARRALIAKGVMDFVPTVAILTAAASLGCWLSYIQGRWLGNTQTVKGICRISTISAQPACLTATACWRCWRAFLAFVRTLLPTMAGISGLPNRRFQFFNWLSALLWVGVVTGLGYALSMIPS
jgi:membrane protein DedA with SNARE-associated domain